MGLGDSDRRLLAEACRILANAGLAEDILGHVSLRTSDGLAVRCRGHAESGLLFTTEKDIHEISSEPLDPTYSVPNELPIHTEVLRARPDVNSVVHVHAPYVVAADLANIELRPVIGAFNIPAMRMAANRIPIYGRSVLVNSPELGREMAACLGDSPALIMRGHGIVTVGSTIQEAVVQALNVEMLAKVLVRASAVGPVTYEVPEKDQELMPDLGGTFNETFVWQYQKALLRHAGLELVEHVGEPSTDGPAHREAQFHRLAPADSTA